MHPWVRRLLVYVLLTVAGWLFLVSRLPSPRQLADRLPRPAPAANPAPAPTDSAGLFGLAPVPMNEDGVLAAPSPIPAAAPKPIEKTADDRARERELFRAILAEDPRDNRTCELLGRTKPRTPQAVASEEHYGLADLFGTDRSDGVLEAYRGPVRAIFQRPDIASLLREMDGYESELDGKASPERESFLAKVGFYSRVARAAAGLIADRHDYERRADRATHLAAIAKLALVSPEARDDSRITDYCRRIAAESEVPTGAELRAEREDLLALLAEKGVKPEAIGFNPEEWTRLSAKVDGNRLAIEMTGRAAP